MQRTVERPPKRFYWIQLASMDAQTWPAPFKVEADVLCEKESETIELKREGQVVATIKSPVAAWWIEEIHSRAVHTA